MTVANMLAYYGMELNTNVKSMQCIVLKFFVQLYRHYLTYIWFIFDQPKVAGASSSVMARISWIDQVDEHV